MKQILYVYCVQPIDDFHLWMRPSDVFNAFGSDDLREIKEFEDVFDTARTSARLIGWEGDIREGPFISMLPPNEGGSSSLFIVAWKQDNNGTSFVASPYILPWISNEDVDVVCCEIEWRPGELIIKRRIGKAKNLKVL